MTEMTTQRHWQAPDRLQIKRDPNFGYKYFRKEDLERRLNEGWEVCKDKEQVNSEAGRVDGSQHFRGLVLMRMPKQMVEERNRHYREKHTKRLRASAAAAGMRDKARSVNDTVGDDLTGTIGKGLTIHEGVRTDDGLIHTNTTRVDVNEVNDEDKQDLAEVHKRVSSQKEEKQQGVEGEESGSPTSTKRRSKRR